MCNPRKVMINLSKRIEEAWRQSVEETEQCDANICETGRLNANILLNSEMGPQSLIMLERVLSGEFDDFPAWDRDESGNFIRNLDDVVIRYSPENTSLQIEAKLLEKISAKATATQELCGFTAGEVASEVVTHYYDDGWGGRTKDKVEKEAKIQAEKRLDDAINQLHREQNKEAFTIAEKKAKDEATNKAKQKLVKLANETRKAMQENLKIILHNAVSSARYEMNIAIGEAYRQTFLALVEKNHGSVISDTKTGRVMELEFEL